MSETLDIEFPEEDSPSLTDQEVAEAIPVQSVKELASTLSRSVKEDEQYLLGHELLRRGEHLFWRVTLGAPEGQNRTRTFRADWLQK